MSKTKYSNDFLEHYMENNISPVRQNIESLEKHFSIRKALYRTLGILPVNFESKKILEVGPGSGYNSLFFASLAPSKLVLLEPNPTGVSHIKNLFATYNMESANVSIENLLLEDYEPNELFDMVFCEGLLPGIRDKKAFLKKMSRLIKPEGVLVVTTSDEVSVFYETIRYFIAQKLTEGVDSFEEKIKILVNSFGSHLDTLKGFGRLKEDWCADSLLGNAIYNYDISMKDCIQFIEDEFFFYNSSPSILTDYSWFKQQKIDSIEYNEKFCQQFERIHHNLFHYQVILPEREREANKELEVLCANFVESMRKHFKEGASDLNILNDLKNIFSNLKGLDEKIDKSLSELIQILERKDYLPKSISESFPNFASSFGRGQQYVSFIKAAK